MSKNKRMNFYAYEVKKTSINNNLDRSDIDRCLNALDALTMEDRARGTLRLDELKSKTVDDHNVWLMHLSRSRELGPGKRKPNAIIDGIGLANDEEFAEDVAALYCPSSGYFLMQSSVYISRGMVQDYFEEFSRSLINKVNATYEILDVMTFNGTQKLLASEHAQRFTFKITHDGSHTNAQVTDEGLPFWKVAKLMSENYGGSEITITVGNGRKGLGKSIISKISSASTSLKSKGYLDNATVDIRPDVDTRLETVNLIEGRRFHECYVSLDAFARPKLSSRYLELEKFYLSLI